MSFRPLRPLTLSFLLVFVTGGVLFAQEIGSEEPLETEKVLTAQSISLLFNDRSLELDFKKRPELLMEAPKHSLQIKGQSIPLSFKMAPLMANGFLDIETSFETVINPENLKLFLEEEGILIDTDKIAVEIKMEKSEETGESIPTFEGVPRAGYNVRFARLVTLIDHAILFGQTYVRVSAERIFSPVKIDKELQKRGIKEIISIGQSNFEGSSKSRKQNITAGIKRFNGYILPKGELFSFNKILGSVDEKDGFVRELVIKGNQTLKEPGGGMCQVSTTAFRAAFTGGFPIDSRRAHSYAVQYYTPYGLDATIYLGGQDFQFTNDTEGDILIQTVMDEEKNNLYFVFYGTNPGKIVRMEGPFITNWQKAPADQIIETEILPAGVRQVVSDAHPGFRAEWTRTVLYNGELETNELISTYRPWPKQTLVGAAQIAKSE